MREERADRQTNIVDKKNMTKMTDKVDIYRYTYTRNNGLKDELKEEQADRQTQIVDKTNMTTKTENTII